MTYGETLALVLDVMQPLDASDRRRLAKAIWDEVEAASSSSNADLTQVQKAELLRRRDEHRANLNNGFTWEQIKADSRARRGEMIHVLN